MKPVYICVFALLWSSALAEAQSSNPHRNQSDMIPPVYRGEGIVRGQADSHKLERQTEEPNPQQPNALGVDRAQIRRDADELSRLAQLISGQVDDTEKGTLPKDLNDNLKKIQKLSKHLRDELKL